MDEPVDETRSRWFEDGINKKKAEQFEEAAASFNRVLETRPRSAPTHWELGLLYADQLDEYATAIYHFNRFKEISPSDTRTRIAEEKIISCKKQIADEIPQISRDQVTHQIISERNELRQEKQRLLNDRSALQAQVDQLKSLVARLEGRPEPPPAATTTTSTVKATTAKPAPTKPTYELPSTHTVSSGDTFYSIASRYHLNAKELERANPSVNPKRMQIGQVIKLPPPSR